MKERYGFEPEAFEMDPELDESSELFTDEQEDTEFDPETVGYAETGEFTEGRSNPFVFETALFNGTSEFDPESESDFEDQEDSEDFEDSETGRPTPTSKGAAAPRRSVSAGKSVATAQPCEVLDGFDFNKDAVKPQHQRQLIAIARRIIDSLKTRQQIHSVKIIGHTDPVGDAKYNFDLGRRRAKQIESELRRTLDRTAPGSSSRLTFSVESRGETAPTGRGAVKDRRVQVCFPQAPPPDCAPQKSRVRLHIKILIRPKRFSIATMVKSMQQVFAPAGFRVQVVSTETLKLPALEDLDIRCPGSTSVCCPFPCASSTLNAEHIALFRNRNRVGTNELAVYFVRATTPTLNGCCAHPSGRPGVVVTENASRWSLAHEVAHVLGLQHVKNNDRLMTEFGTNNITSPPPDLIRTEIEDMQKSALSIPC